MVIKIKTKGFEKASAKLQPESLLYPALSEAIAEGVKIVQKEAEGRAPRKSGKTAGAIKGKVTGKQKTMGIVSVNRTVKGFRLPQALNYGGRYRYQKGSRRGQSTKGWFTGSLDEAKGRVVAALETAAKDIEKRFGR